MNIKTLQSMAPIDGGDNHPPCQNDYACILASMMTKPESPDASGDLIDRQLSVENTPKLLAKMVHHPQHPSRQDHHQQSPMTKSVTTATTTIIPSPTSVFQPTTSTSSSTSTLTSNSSNHSSFNNLTVLVNESSPSTKITTTSSSSPVTTSAAPNTCTSADSTSDSYSSPTICENQPTVPSMDSFKCDRPQCMLCLRGCPTLVIRNPTWSTIMRVVFYTLSRSYPHQPYFNLRADVYNWMDEHWNYLCKPSHKDRDNNWRKQVQDMLSHSKNLFESGTEHFRQNGFWRLKPSIDIDPWTIKKPPRDKSKIPLKKRSLSENDLGNHLKRKSKSESDDESEPDLPIDELNIRDFLVKNDEDVKRELDMVTEEIRKAKNKMKALWQHMGGTSSPIFEENEMVEEDEDEGYSSPPSHPKKRMLMVSPPTFSSLRNSDQVAPQMMSPKSFHAPPPPPPPSPSSYSIQNIMNPCPPSPTSPPPSPSHYVSPSSNQNQRLRLTKSLPSLATCIPHSPSMTITNSLVQILPSPSPSPSHSSSSSYPNAPPVPIFLHQKQQPPPQYQQQQANGFILNQHPHHPQHLHQMQLQQLHIQQQQQQQQQQYHQYAHQLQLNGQNYCASVPINAPQQQQQQSNNNSSCNPTPTSTPLLVPNKLEPKSQSSITYIIDINN
ncbi:hypothetical protein DFA_00703 [Cavenderia fasciculata]|uniref:Uncharacterized protein n=1 Tax=Cavenderia fasciculata TaxID=261658 RepID=F4PTA2_CACFS|nr:uncharacterized protein DFA_00703 [Cavenderia fasciculata]EGG20838.1 hypothetical protein DFA_00703 [Cavenderia fasciculata]|eukprot:XP_004358688.1 hypothetical protein DFA_00703 [Cavenderia fasciculata]